MKSILLVCLIPSLCYSANGYWDSMVWNQDTWYVTAGSVSGTVQTNITGQTTTIVGATVTILETGRATTTDGNGGFSFSEVLVGNYSFQVDMAKFQSVLFNDVQIIEGQVTSLPPVNLVFETSDCGLPGDINNDDQIGLEEAIYALQVASAVQTPTTGDEGSQAGDDPEPATEGDGEVSVPTTTSTSTTTTSTTTSTTTTTTVPEPSVTETTITTTSTTTTTTTTTTTATTPEPPPLETTTTTMFVM